MTVYLRMQHTNSSASRMASHQCTGCGATSSHGAPRTRRRAQRTAATSARTSKQTSRTTSSATVRTETCACMHACMETPLSSWAAARTLPPICMRSLGVLRESECLPRQLWAVLVEAPAPSRGLQARQAGPSCAVDGGHARCGH